MTKNAFTTIAAILLILYSLANFGAGFGHFAKGKMISGTANIASSMGTWAGDTHNAQQIKKEGMSAATVFYLIALFIFITAVLNLAAAVGLFSGQPWAVTLVTVSCIFGVLVEIQDIALGGFGIGKFVFLGINIFAFLVAQSAKKSAEAPAIV